MKYFHIRTHWSLVRTLEDKQMNNIHTLQTEKVRFRRLDECVR